MNRHRLCPVKAMTYTEYGAQCGSCGLRWQRTARGYVLVSAPRVVA